MTIKEQWNKVKLLHIFEIAIIDKRNGEPDFIIFNIKISEDTFKAEHIPLTQIEEDSEYVAFKSINIDTDFSLDRNLEELYQECIQGILDSDFYTLAD